jgi:aspartyl-tRNA(Asn)/glutamyl-tRNA(Gln) amidotransferase subunit A
VAPRFDACADDDSFARENSRALRNPTVANFFDLCAIALPIPDSGALPVGLMLVGRHGSDRRLLAIAAAVESALHAM